MTNKVIERAGAQDDKLAAVVERIADKEGVKYTFGDSIEDVLKRLAAHLGGKVSHVETDEDVLAIVLEHYALTDAKAVPVLE